MRIVAKGLWWCWLALVPSLGVLVDECYCGLVYDTKVTVLKCKNENMEVMNDLGCQVKRFINEELEEVKRILLNRNGQTSFKVFVTGKIDKEGNHEKLIRRHIQMAIPADVLILVKYFESHFLNKELQNNGMSKICTMLWKRIEEEQRGPDAREQRGNGNEKVLDAIWGAFGGYRGMIEVGVYYTYRTDIELATLDLNKEITVEAGANRERKRSVGFMTVNQEERKLPGVLRDLIRKVDEDKCENLTSARWLLDDCENGSGSCRSGNAAAMNQDVTASLTSHAPAGTREVEGPLKSFILYIFQTMCYAAADLLQNDEALKRSDIYVKYYSRGTWFTIKIRDYEGWWKQK